MKHPLGDKTYEYGMDEPISLARTITVESEQEAAETYAQALRKELPTAYVVRAVVRCNQLDTFRMIACDWSSRIEARRETIQARATTALRHHLRKAHPYLARDQVRQLVGATQFNFRDIGR